MPGFAVIATGIDNAYFEQMESQIYPAERQLNKANSSDTEAFFLDLDLSITINIVSSKLCDKRADFNFPFLVEMFLSPLPMVYTFCNLFFVRVCFNVDDHNNRNNVLSSRLLK